LCNGLQLYAPELVVCFSATVKALLQAHARSNDTTNNAVAYVVTTIRNPSTFALFEKEAAAQGMVFEDVTALKHNTPVLFPHYSRDSIVINRLSLPERTS
jgi:hypothetical protein